MSSVPSPSSCPGLAPTLSDRGNSPDLQMKATRNVQASTPPVSRNCDACHAFSRVPTCQLPRYRLWVSQTLSKSRCTLNRRRREDRSPRNDAAGPHDPVPGTHRSLQPQDDGLVVVDRDAALAAAEQSTTGLAAGVHCGPSHGIPSTSRRSPTSLACRRRPARRSTSPCPARPTPLSSSGSSAGAVPSRQDGHDRVSPACPPRHPNPVERGASTPGGWSSGSAAAVAGMCSARLPGAGEPITRPASYYGVAGSQPTFGRVSRAGVVLVELPPR